MTAATSPVSPASLQRALGDWQSSDGPVYAALAAALRGALVDGRLALDTRLPAERALATRLGLSRTTVAAAYQRLREQGYLISRRGSGSRSALPDAQRPPAPATVWSGPPTNVNSDPPRLPDIDLAIAAPPALVDPVLRAQAWASEELPRYLSGHGYHPLGLTCLRQAIADTYTEQGLPTTPDEVLITNGALHGLSLALRELTGDGDRVLADCPTYPNALDTIRAARCRVTPVGLPETGWDVELFTAVLRQAAPAVGYLVPDFHNPTGLLMPAQTRERIVAEASATGTPLIVDETFRDLAFDGHYESSPAQWDTRGVVLTVGSLNKSYWGGLRIGWVRATPALVARLGDARARDDMAGPVIDQLVVTHLLRSEGAALDQRRAWLAARCAAALGALARHAPEWVVRRPSGGVSLWVRLPTPIATELARRAASAGVRVVPGPRFGPDGTMDRFFRLPYTVAPAELDSAVRTLAHVAERIRPGAGADPGWIA